MKNSSFDFIKYSKSPLKSGDFNGKESDLSLDQQIQFLKEYKDSFLSFNNRNFAKKLISNKEIKSYLKEIKKEENSFRKRQYIRKGILVLKDLNEFEFLHLYGNKAFLKDGLIHLEDTDLYPGPSFDFLTPFEVSEYSITLHFQEKFITPLRCDIDTTTGGIYLELRNGIEDIGRIQFYSNGDVYLRILENDIYHHTNKFIGNVDYHKDLNVRFLWCNEGYLINVNNFEILLKSSLKANYLLFSSGQYPNGSSIIKINNITSNNNEIVDPFKKHKQEKDIILKKESLPCSLGGFKYHNKWLSFQTSFVNNFNKDVFIHLGSLNPSGKVYINNSLVLSTNSFISEDLNITQYLKKGENKLELVVDPRSPENIISWHRSKDPYYASYCDEVYLEEKDKTYISFLKAFTTSLVPIKTTSNVEIISNKKQELVLKVNCKNKEYLSLNISLNNGVNTLDFETIFNDLKPWDSTSPNLYEISFSLFNEEKLIDVFLIRYGFRIIKQENGDLIYNQKPFIMKGALLMQYLPKYEDLTSTHVCPSNYLILAQFLMAKKMNSNTIRMHSLGYGNNELRYARIADYLGINIIWTTSYIDSLGSCIFNNEWKQKNNYLTQIKTIINSPSVIAYEGINEMSLNVEDISLMYKEFVSSIKTIDPSRLLFPISHLYYGGDSYKKGRTCGYILDDGTLNQDFKPIKVSKEWNDELVVRSAHTYNWLLGYGTSWDELRKQSWSGQECLLKSKNHAYVVSEFAIIGRINPNSVKKGDFYNDKSYEYPDEYSLGYDFSNDYSLSQTYQLLAAKYCCIKMLSLGVDGLLWCSLISGANDGSYLKPVIDFNFYPKYAFEGLKVCYSDLFIADNTTDIYWDNSHVFRPTLFGLPDNKKHDITIEIKNLNNKSILKKKYYDVVFDVRNKEIDNFKINFKDGGYYKIVYHYN